MRPLLRTIDALIEVILKSWMLYLTSFVLWHTRAKISHWLSLRHNILIVLSSTLRSETWSSGFNIDVYVIVMWSIGAILIVRSVSYHF